MKIYQNGQNWIIYGIYAQTKGIRQTFNADYEIVNKFGKINFSKNFNYG